MQSVLIELQIIVELDIIVLVLYCEYSFNDASQILLSKQLQHIIDKLKTIEEVCVLHLDEGSIQQRRTCVKYNRQARELRAEQVN